MQGPVSEAAMLKWDTGMPRWLEFSILIVWIEFTYKARDDSGQKEAERSNACIGYALVDDGALRWKFHDVLVGLTQYEIELLSLDSVKKRDEPAI